MSQTNSPGYRRKLQTDETDIFTDETIQNSVNEMRNESAVAVLERVKQKFMGRDFDPESELTEEDQVKELIDQATNLENLCQAFPGWYAYW